MHRQFVPKPNGRGGLGKAPQRQYIIDPYSAGTVAQGVSPRAVQVMEEAGVDISHHTSKEAESMMDIPFDYVITVCSSADEHCPSFSGKVQVIHVAFDDLPSLARSAQNEDDALAHFRCVRDKIRAFIETLLPE